MNAKATRLLGTFIFCSFFFVHWHLKARLSSLANNDPFPAFSTHNSYDFLSAYHRDFLKGLREEDLEQRISFSVSPFFQKAKKGKDRWKQKSELGNLRGNWNIVGLLYGDIPCGYDRPDILKRAFEGARFCSGPELCPLIDVADSSILTTTRFMHDPQFTDTSKHFGFLSVPIKYRKVGVRFETIGMITKDIGIDMLFGVSDITQTTTGVTDLTTTGTAGGIFADADNQQVVHEFLMSKIDQIFEEIGINIHEYHETSVEDFQASLFWRHAFAVNTQKKNKEKDEYPQFLFIPFLTVDGSLGLGKVKNPAYALSLPFGNNGHHAVGFSAGFTLDFHETIEIGISGGGTHFLQRSFCNVFVPTHELQFGIFPFKTDINVEPGNNWHFTALFNARNFIENLSFHAQYIFVTHTRDTICLVRPNWGTHISVLSCPDSTAQHCTFSPDPGQPGAESVFGVFKPARLADDSAWSSQMIDAALNYDISTHASLGCLIQIPITRRNAYRSTTFMSSFEARF